MGIHGLATYIRRVIPHIQKAVKTETGTHWAIDCSCILFRARAEGLPPQTVMAGLIVRLRNAGVEPIVVFDGTPPASKSAVTDSRRQRRETAHREMEENRRRKEDTALTPREHAALDARHTELQRIAPRVSRDDWNATKQLLYAAGVLFVVARGEADDLLGFLARSGTVQAVVSTDLDMLARGVPALVIPETADATVLSQIALADVLEATGLTYPQFVDACLLMGTDYSGADWRGVIPTAAVETARRGVDWASLPGTAMEGLIRLCGIGVTWEDLLDERQREKWAAGATAVEAENLAEMARVGGWPAGWLDVLANNTRSP